MAAAAWRAAAPQLLQPALIVRIVALAVLCAVELFGQSDVEETIRRRCLLLPADQKCDCDTLESCLAIWSSAVTANMGTDTSPLARYGKPGPLEYRVAVIRADPRVFYGTVTGSVFGTGVTGQYVADVVPNVTVNGTVFRCRVWDAQGRDSVDFSQKACFTLTTQGMAPPIDQVSELPFLSRDEPGYPLVPMSRLPVLYVAYPLDKEHPTRRFPVFHMSPGTYADGGGYSVYATLLASHGFVAIVPFIYWPPLGTVPVAQLVTFTGNNYISMSLSWICLAGRANDNRGRAYCPLDSRFHCDQYFIGNQIPGLRADCEDVDGSGGVVLGGHSGGGAWALWAGLHFGLNPAYKVKALVLHDAGFIPGMNAPLKFNWERARGSGLKILAATGRWMTLLKEQHRASYEDPALDGCAGNVSRDGRHCAGASRFGWFPPGAEPKTTMETVGNASKLVNLGHTPETESLPDGIFGSWIEYTSKYGGACSDGIGSAGLGSQTSFVVQANYPSRATLPPPEVQNYEVEQLYDTSEYLDGDVVSVAGSWQHVPCISNWQQGVNITRVATLAAEYGNINAMGVGYVPLAAKFGVAWALYAVRGDQRARSRIFAEARHEQEYCNLVTCAGFAMPGTGPAFGTYLKRAGGTQKEDIKCVRRRVQVDWHHRGRLVTSASQLHAVDMELGPQLLSQDACSPGSQAACLRRQEALEEQTAGSMLGAWPRTAATAVAAVVVVLSASSFAAGAALARRGTNLQAQGLDVALVSAM